MRENPLSPLADAMEAQPMPELSAADLAALSPLWGALGKSGQEAQRTLLQSVREAVAVQIDSAREKEQRDKRLYTSLGLIGACATFLFLM